MSRHKLVQSNGDVMIYEVIGESVYIVLDEGRKKFSSYNPKPILLLPEIDDKGNELARNVDANPDYEYTFDLRQPLDPQLKDASDKMKALLAPAIKTKLVVAPNGQPAPYGYDAASGAPYKTEQEQSDAIAAGTAFVSPAFTDTVATQSPRPARK